MRKPSPLPARQMTAAFNCPKIPWASSAEIPLSVKNGRNPYQARAMQALDLSLSIDVAGYNIYVCGEPNSGRTHTVFSYLKNRASKKAIPDDLIYARNFNDADAPVLLALPAGAGKKFKNLIRELITHIRLDLDKKLSGNIYARQRTELQTRYQSRRNDLLHKMETIASSKGFTVEMDENDAVILSAQNEAKSRYKNQSELKKSGENLSRSLSGYLRELRKAEALLQESEHSLDKSAMAQTLDILFPSYENKILKIRSDAKIKNYLEDLKKDILANTANFLADYAQENPQGSQNDDNEAGFFKRYDINLFVDNSDLTGAPIIVEDHPNAVNLLGCMERESEMGALVTDFTLIRSGSLHRANGGFLIIHADDLLQHPLAWDGLLRALRANTAKIIDEGEILDSPLRTRGLWPEPVKLNLKVILIGDDDLYELLLEREEQFEKLFRVKAHLMPEIERNSTNIRTYLTSLAQIAKNDQLLPFDNGALAWLVNLGSHLCQDQRKLSLKFPLLREYMVEASAFARAEGNPCVTAAILETASTRRAHRANLVEEFYHEDYERQIMKVKTSGKAIGQVNGLAVSWTGNYEFGLPHRISCAVGVGHDGIIDLEREADLGGPIHTKAIMILKTYLTSLFASKRPLVLSATIHFEQNYGEIEGDSASGAELVALLSALAQAPVRLDLAFTGAVSHSGEIMAVGGVTPKIEGFYKICKAAGLTGTQGVIIPADNIANLMLSPQIIASAEKGEFSIYPVRHIEEALYLLTDFAPGKRRKDGSFTRKSLFDLVDRRLELLGVFAQNAFKHPRKE